MAEVNIAARAERIVAAREVRPSHKRKVAPIATPRRRVTDLVLGTTKGIGEAEPVGPGNHVRYDEHLRALSRRDLIGKQIVTAWADRQCEGAAHDVRIDRGRRLRVPDATRWRAFTR